ncbi:cAMP-regulated phosphoprotein 19 [Blomia tropicalis]|nr:cAMP-regulated phosphoprotein 19 [Blomia tropicalis]
MVNQSTNIDHCQRESSKTMDGTKMNESNKYGNLTNRCSSPQFVAQRRLNRGGQKYFDSGDYAMAKASPKTSVLDQQATLPTVYELSSPVKLPSPQTNGGNHKSTMTTVQTIISKHRVSIGSLSKLAIDDDKA